ncbi:MAG: hypothetical protein HY013_04320 [Candidatus Solibacter usitatus]|nr:hypothetical protein [Candidatus Solibacter usitatus]
MAITLAEDVRARVRKGLALMTQPSVDSLANLAEQLEPAVDGARRLSEAGSLAVDAVPVLREVRRDLARLGRLLHQALLYRTACAALAAGVEPAYTAQGLPSTPAFPGRLRMEG